MTSNERLDHESEQPAVSVYQLPTGSYRTRAMFAFRGGSPFDVRHFAATALLVRHPLGDILIDAGFGRRFEEHFRMLPRFRQQAHRLGTPAVDQLITAGYDPKRLSGILLTHSHWDHVSGIADFGAPILLPAAEVEYAAAAKDDRIFAAVSAKHWMKEYEFDGDPYRGFASSHDLYGDGSIVIVPAPGHTAGSVIVFVRLPTGKEYAFVGDLAWQLEGIQRNVDRPLIMRMLADSDPRRIREDLARITMLADQVQIVPAHDSRGFAGIPLLLDDAAV